MRNLLLLLSVLTLSLCSCGNNDAKENTTDTQTAVIAKMQDNEIVFTNK